MRRRAEGIREHNKTCILILEGCFNNVPFKRQLVIRDFSINTAAGDQPVVDVALCCIMKRTADQMLRRGYNPTPLHAATFFSSAPPNKFHDGTSLLFFFWLFSFVVEFTVVCDSFLQLHSTHHINILYIYTIYMCPKSIHICMIHHHLSVFLTSTKRTKQTKQTNNHDENICN